MTINPFRENELPEDLLPEDRLVHLAQSLGLPTDVVTEWLGEVALWALAGGGPAPERVVADALRAGMCRWPADDRSALGSLHRAWERVRIDDPSTPDLTALVTKMRAVVDDPGLIEQWAATVAGDRGLAGDQDVAAAVMTAAAVFETYLDKASAALWKTIRTIVGARPPF